VFLISKAGRFSVSVCVQRAALFGLRQASERLGANGVEELERSRVPTRVALVLYRSRAAFKSWST